MEAYERSTTARLLAVNVGLPRDVTWRMVRRLNVDGDGQGVLAGHGGEHRAVFVYQIEPYRYWEAQLGRHDFTYGQFGENFTVEGLTAEVIDDAGVPTGGDFYICGPAPFMHDVRAALVARAVTPDRLNTEIFGSSDAITPGVIDAATRPAHRPEGPPGTGQRSHSAER